jgi:hypothetical protein
VDGLRALHPIPHVLHPLERPGLHATQHAARCTCGATPPEHKLLPFFRPTILQIFTVHQDALPCSLSSACMRKIKRAASRHKKNRPSCFAILLNVQCHHSPPARARIAQVIRCRMPNGITTVKLLSFLILRRRSVRFACASRSSQNKHAPREVLPFRRLIYLPLMLR